MRVIKAHYKDSNYEQDVIITDLENRTYSLSFELDGIRFIGIWFSSFILADTAQFEEAKEKFKIVKHGPYDGNYVYALQRYNICASIPVSVHVAFSSSCDVSLCVIGMTIGALISVDALASEKSFLHKLHSQYVSIPVDVQVAFSPTCRIRLCAYGMITGALISDAASASENSFSHTEHSQ